MFNGIPTSGEMKNLLDMYTMNGNDLSKFYEAFNMPFAGRRNHEDMNMDGVGTESRLWMATNSDNDIDRSYRFLANTGKANISDIGIRANAFPVRCFADTPIIDEP